MDVEPRSALIDNFGSVEAAREIVDPMFRGLFFGVAGSYLPTEKMRADGIKFEHRLQTDGHSYLCPSCGGYGRLATKPPGDDECGFCKGTGSIGLDDPRVRKLA